MLAPSFLVHAFVAMIAGAPSPSTAVAPFDPVEWELVQERMVDLGGDKTGVKALLLRSREPKGTSGTDSPMFGVEMILAKNGRSLYRFTSKEEFFVDDDLRIEDVTGDRAPEVLFHAGTLGASDGILREHVVRLSEDGRFGDVGRREFYRTALRQMDWLALQGAKLAVIAEPLDPQDENDPHFGHLPRVKFYQYLVYRWDKVRKAFVLWRSIQSRTDISTDSDPLEVDLAFIKSELSKRCP